MQAFKTPGKLRGAKTPAFKHTAKRKSTRNSPQETADIFQFTAAALHASHETVDSPTKSQATPNEPIETRGSPADNVSTPQDEEIEMLDAPLEPPRQETAAPEEEDQEPTPTPTQHSPVVQLYTDSDIGSPSVHATPEKPLRKGSFSFAPLPARDPLKQSLGAPNTDIKPTVNFLPSSAVVQYGRQQSLGLDSDDEESDHESLDLRAPELIAHEERMRAYESPTPPPAPSRGEELELEERPEQSVHNGNDMPGTYPSMEDLEPMDTEEPLFMMAKSEEAPIRQGAPAKTKSKRLTATKPLGRPVRPNNVQKPQPVPIKIKTLRPINTAPVAAHNQETVRKENQKPELTRKPSTQYVTPGPSKIQKTTKPVPSKVLSLAQKKKKLDEEAAAKDAAIKQQQKERRDNKIEELKKQKLEEEIEKDRKARDNSAEKQRRHITDMDGRENERERSETRQEREEKAAQEKKDAFRKLQEQRDMQQATKPVIKPVIKSLAPPKIAVKAPARAQTQNPPPRPPARLDHHDEPEEPSEELPAYPSNLSKPPVRASIKKPSIFTSTNQNLQQFPQPPARVAPQMQQFATQRIPFANEVAQHHHAVTQQQLRPPAQAGPSMNTPFIPMRSMHTIQAIQNSTPATEMSLPEIHTDSSDDSDRAVDLPSWATPGHVFDRLSQQETVNPDQIFPRIPTISMDDVFAENPDRLRRLRMRTSSANWIRTGDALTQVEVIEDRIGRQAIRNAGGWVYGLGNGN